MRVRALWKGLVAGMLVLAACAGGDLPPPAPLGLSAAPGNGSITLTWHTDQEVTEYTLYWSTSRDVTFTDHKVENVTNPFSHFPRQNYVRVYYRVSASNINGESVLSQEVSAEPSLTATAPGAAASLTATAGDGQVRLTWGAVSGATKYTVYRDTVSGVTPANGTPITCIGSPLDDTGLSNGSTYYYVVTATVGSKEGVPSAQVSATPQSSGVVSAPANLTAVAGDKQVTLSWNTVTGASTYTLYWGTAAGVKKTTGTALVSVTSPYLHTGLKNGQTYYYVVTATDAAGESAESTEAYATPVTGGVPAAPANLKATAGDKKVTLSWNAVTGASSYTLYWGAATGVSKTTGTAIKGVTSPHQHLALTNGKAYYYVVTATNTSGESLESQEATATPKAGASPPAAPTNLKAVAGNKQVTLSWKAVTGAANYTLYWGLASGVTKKKGTAIKSVKSPYKHIALTNGQTYYYIVTSSNTAGESAGSKEASAKPTSPAKGTITSTLTGGAYAVVLLENMSNKSGLIQVQVYTADPTGTPPGTGISGLSVVGVKGATGALAKTSTAGVYQGTVSGLFTPDTYVFSVTGTVSGTVSATLTVIPTCSITAPISGSIHSKGKDLPLKWTSTNSEKAMILLEDQMGTVTYNPLSPDPGVAIIPGKDIPYAAKPLTILVSAVWTAKSAKNNAGLIVMGDGQSQITLQ